MDRLTLLWFIMTVSSVSVFAQNEMKFSAVNPALFLYTTEDIFVNPPLKYNNGSNIIAPNPTIYPWEARLENGMPNVIRDINGNLSIYISSFVSYSSTPPSKVGALVYTNNTNQVNDWQRPDAGLYWYNPNGTTSDEKITGTYQDGYQATNIVAVDIESLGIYDDYETNNKPIKLIYLPQRESHNKLISAYEMDKSFNDLGILQGFYSMKNDRITNQKEFTFDFINGDTHMNFMKQDGAYYFVSRLNAKRSFLQDSETLPLRPDNRKRYRRETLTKIGEELISKQVDFNIILEMSNSRWEPYSMQPFRLPGFENDIWWGLVTMFGTEGDSEVQYKQRTELAISNDGENWTYLKPGVPFLDNSNDPLADDYGCINIAKPILNTKFTDDPMAAYYFYAASNIRHVDGRNPGISLATGNYGKLAGLRADNIEKRFYSMLSNGTTIQTTNMPSFSVGNAFRLGSEPLPYILSDVTDDPRNQTVSQLDSYVAVLMYVYSNINLQGKGAFLGGSLGSSIQGTNTVSEDYEIVPFTMNGISNSKEHILNYLKEYSEQHPTEVVSLKNFEEFPIVLEAWVKNATFYGMMYKNGEDVDNAGVDFYAPSHYQDPGLWSYTPEIPSAPCHTEDFTQTKQLPNQKRPLKKETGSFALAVTPESTTTYQQTIIRMYGDNKNDIGVYYGVDGDFQYVLKKDGLPFASMSISPPNGKTFINKKVTLTIESVKNDKRKYGKNLNEESTIFRVSCPDIEFEEIIQQRIIWNWKHEEGNITAADSANARAFSYLASTAFVAGMDTISVGGSNFDCDNEFTGSIHQIEIADYLPSWESDFWNSQNIETLSVNRHKKDLMIGNELSFEISSTPLYIGDPIQLRVTSKLSQKVKLKLLDISGKIITEMEYLNEKGENCLKFDVPYLLPGNYELVYSSETSSVSSKIKVINKNKV